MSNKKLGNEFERKIIKQLRETGHYVIQLPQNVKGQPFDLLVTVHNGVAAVDCKMCSKGYFDLNRIEPNQHTAFEMFRKANSESFAGFMLGVKSEIYCIGYEDMVNQPKKRLNYEDIKRIGEFWGIYDDEDDSK